MAKFFKGDKEMKLSAHNRYAQTFFDDVKALRDMADLVSKGFDTARENEREFGERKSGVAFSKVGKNADGRSIYKTNYPLNTPKNIKRQDIIDIVQNVWSKKPIFLTVIENSIKKEITARFNPEISERSDLSKIAFGNRKRSASEQRMTLDLSSDLYAIAEEAKFTKSKEEIGKLNNPAHDDVTLWHYFITNMIYRDSNDNDIECYMNIDVKKNKDGYWFYSFAIEKGTAPQTLLAAVTDKKSATVPNDNIPRSFEKSNPSIQKNSDSGKYSKDDTIIDPDELDEELLFTSDGDLSFDGYGTSAGKVINVEQLMQEQGAEQAIYTLYNAADNAVM